VLREFRKDFAAGVESTSELKTSEVFEVLNDILAPYVFPAREDGSDPRSCPSCEGGRLAIKRGKNGPFIGCSNYPDCRFTRDLTAPGDGDADALANGNKVLGVDPDSNLEVTVRTGRFGPYIQLGEPVEGEKPKRASIPKGVDAASVDLERALSYLSLPREVGMHPETGKPITAGIGRYGPFVLHDGTYANLDSAEEVFTVGLNRAVTVIAEKKERGGRRGAAATIKALGDHADFGGPIEVKAGRYGPYVTNGKINATLPKGTDPESVTMEVAAELLAAKAEKSGKGGKAAKGGKSKTAKSKTTKSKASKGKAKSASKSPKES